MSSIDVDQILSDNSITANQGRIDSVREQLFGRSRVHAPPHYELRGQIGKGSFGRVFLAYDRRLGREVAIKSIPYSTKDDKRRIEREARSIARISHDNIVQIYETGQADDGIYYLALEYVRGVSLEGWLSTKTRALDELLRVFLDIARGLHAAHQKNIVHRDFKPANVMIGDDGQVKILDFGLAKLNRAERERIARTRSVLAEVDFDRTHEHSRRPDDSHDGQYAVTDAAGGRRESSTSPETACDASIPATPRDSEYGALAESLSGRDGFAGTTMFASLEQLDCDEADDRSDQFSYCLVLFEALFGYPAFEGKTPRTRREAIAAGRIASGRPMRTIPSWLEDLVTKGLAASPDQRHPDMGPIIEALQGHLRPRSRSWLHVLAGAAVGIGMLVTLTVAIWSSRETVEWGDTWSETERATLEERHGPGLVRRLDDYRQRWSDVATQLNATWRPWDKLTAQMACLDIGRHEFQRVVSDALDNVPASRPRSSMGAPAAWVTYFYDPEACRAKQPTGREPGWVERMLAIQELHRRGEYAQALSKIEEVREQIGPRIGLLFGMIEYQRGTTLLAMGRPDAWGALFDAAQDNAGDREFLFDVLVRRVQAAVFLQRSPEETEDAIATARRWQETTDDHHEDIDAWFQFAEAQALHHDDPKRAEEGYEAALQGFRRLAVDPSTDLGVGITELHLAYLHSRRPETRANAPTQATRAFATLRRYFGDGHPALARYALGVARVHLAARHPETRENFELAKQLGERAGSAAQIETIRARAELLYLDIGDGMRGGPMSARPNEEWFQAGHGLEQALNDTPQSTRSVHEKRIWTVIAATYEVAGRYPDALGAIERWWMAAQDEQPRAAACKAFRRVHKKLAVRRIASEATPSETETSLLSVCTEASQR